VEAARSSTGLALVLGSVGAVILLMASWVLGGTVGTGLRVLSLFLPGLLLQDAWRYAFLSAGKPAKAVANDLAWAVLQGGAVGWVLWGGSDGVGAFVWAWGGAGSVAGLLGCAQAGVVPNPRSSMVWLRLHRDLWPRFAAEFLLGSGSAHFLFFAVGLISGLATVGVLNASRVILGPFNILALGAVGFAVPEGVSIWRRKPNLLMPALRGLGASLALLALACGGLVLLLPETLGEAIVGASWRAVRDVMPFMTVFVAAAGVSEAARVGLRVLAVADRSLAARATTAPLVVIGAVLGALIGDAKGAAVGLALSHLVGSHIWWHHLTAANRTACGSRVVQSIAADVAPSAHCHGGGI